MTHLRALSLGAGVQSTTLALLAVEGVISKPDVAIFADTHWEPKRVYDHFAKLSPVLEDAGIEVVVVSRGDLRNDMLDPDSRYASVPYYVLAPEHHVVDEVAEVDGVRVPTTRVADRREPSARPATRREREGMGRRQCTSEYKLAPIRRELRRRLGAKPPDYRNVPKGRVAEQWIGFSTDEVGRANRHRDSDGGVRYLDVRYPLLELGMSRADCVRWLKGRGWTPQKSACIGCPYHGNRQWRQMRDHHPEEWADAVAFDAAIRKGGARGMELDGEAFVHRSRLPLAQAPIDRVTGAEWRSRQTDIFGQIADAETGYDADEDGDIDGCSPFGCRSGAVTE